MTELEKVMKELSWLLSSFPLQKSPIDAADRMCNAINMYCNDALALLKRQEPRVLTLEETIALCGEPVWVEENTLHGAYGAWGVVKGLHEQYKAVNIGGVRFGYWARAKYNITWRCWTARPSDGQRKAVKWDE